MNGRRPEDKRIGAELRRLQAPGEDEALERALGLAEAAGREREAFPSRRARHRLLAGAVAALCALAGGLLVLTPAGAAVTDWVENVIRDDPPAPKRALTELPAEGPLLVTSPGGAWVVAADGSRRRLGPYSDATWSPAGLYAAVTRGRQLSAVEPDGTVRWSISRREAVTDPRWAPSGYRVAFREGDSLGIVAGDGTGARELGYTAPTAPTWRPPPAGTDARTEPNVLTYVQSRLIRTVDVDTGRELWRQPSLRRARTVEWAGPDRLIIANPNNVRVLDRGGRLLESIPRLPGTAIGPVTASPDGERVAIVMRDEEVTPESTSRLYLARIAGRGIGDPRRTVFSGFGNFGKPAFSPDGDWILLPWTDTDQWLFISPSEDRKLVRRVIAVGDIARQFDPAGTGPPRAPEVEGWCCP